MCGFRGEREGEEEKEWMWCLDNLGAFGIKANQWMIAAKYVDGLCKTVKQRAGFIMTNRMVALRHVVTCPNLKVRTKERISQSKRARSCRFPCRCWNVVLAWTSTSSGGPCGVYLMLPVLYFVSYLLLLCWFCYISFCFPPLVLNHFHPNKFKVGVLLLLFISCF